MTTNTNYDEFTQNLVLIMLGVKLTNFESQEQAQMVSECTEIYNHYIVEYFANHFPDVNLEQINKLDMADPNNKSVAIDIAQNIEEAYQSFLIHLEETWAE